MAKTLDVYLEDTFVGNLIQDDQGQMVFEYANGWLQIPDAMPLSYSLPLKAGRFTNKECRGFFAGTLPEAGKREIIARNLGISSKNDFSMLERIGGECAGAVTFLPVGQQLKTSGFDYQAIDDHQLANIFRELPRRPLMAGEKDIRLSLAGAQDKIAVYVDTYGKMSMPHGSAISSHILKPAIPEFEGVVFNEALCMMLASAIGLPAAKVEIRRVEDIDYLMVERYDRKQKPFFDSYFLARLHQEDFCQALGIIPEKKYQSEEGPSLKQCFDLLRKVSSTPAIDLARLLDAVIFNYLIGNNDAHGKNFSFLYDRGTLLTGYTRRFAPLYDVLCTAYYPDLSTKMAMKIGGEYSSELVRPKHFDRFAEEIGLTKTFVNQRVPELAEKILLKLPEIVTGHHVSKGVAKFIQNRCEDTINRFVRS